MEAETKRLLRENDSHVLFGIFKKGETGKKLHKEEQKEQKDNT